MSALSKYARTWYRFVVYVGVGAVTASQSLTVWAAPAAQENLLTNPGFNGGYYNWNAVAELAVPNGWDFWYAPEGTPLLAGQSAPWGRPETVVWNIAGAPAWERELFWRDGDYTFKSFGAWRPIWFRLSQTVASLTPGAEYQFVVPVYPDLVVDYNAAGKVFAPDPQSGEHRLVVESGGQIYDSGWRDGASTPFGQWTLLVLTFVAQGPAATLEVEIRGRHGILNNGWFLDDLRLLPTGQTGSVAESATESAPFSNTPRATNTPGPSPTPTHTATPTWPATNTPLPNGEVWWVVRNNDTLAVLAYYHGTTADDIRALNGLSDSLIRPGQLLLMKRVTPAPTATPTLVPTITLPPTLTPGGPLDSSALPPTATVTAIPAVVQIEAPPYGDLCVVTYNDANGNAADDGEPPVSGAQLVLTNENGPLDSRLTGANDEAECFAQLAPGAYRVTVVPPDGFAMTTADMSQVLLRQGQIITLAFGLAPVVEVVLDTPSGRVNMLYALGGGAVLLIIAGFVGISVIARRRR